jgi:hypothetical protein
MTRQTTNKLLEMVEEGLLDRDTLIMACMKYMSEDEVADMARANEFLAEDEDENDEFSAALAEHEDIAHARELEDFSPLDKKDPYVHCVNPTHGV